MFLYYARILTFSILPLLSYSLGAMEADLPESSFEGSVEESEQTSLPSTGPTQERRRSGSQKPLWELVEGPWHDEKWKAENPEWKTLFDPAWRSKTPLSRNIFSSTWRNQHPGWEKIITQGFSYKETPYQYASSRGVSPYTSKIKEEPSHRTPSASPKPYGSTLYKQEKSSFGHSTHSQKIGPTNTHVQRFGHVPAHLVGDPYSRRVEGGPPSKELLSRLYRPEVARTELAHPKGHREGSLHHTGKAYKK